MIGLATKTITIRGTSVARTRCVRVMRRNIAHWHLIQSLIVHATKCILVNGVINKFSFMIEPQTPEIII